MAHRRFDRPLESDDPLHAIVGGWAVAGLLAALILLATAF
jgi:hypothetical protein